MKVKMKKIVRHTQVFICRVYGHDYRPMRMFEQQRSRVCRRCRRIGRLEDFLDG